MVFIFFNLSNGFFVKDKPPLIAPPSAGGALPNPSSNFVLSVDVALLVGCCGYGNPINASSCWDIELYGFLYLASLLIYVVKCGTKATSMNSHFGPSRMDLMNSFIWAGVVDVGVDSSEVMETSSNSLVGTSSKSSVGLVTPNLGNSVGIFGFARLFSGIAGILFIKILSLSDKSGNSFINFCFDSLFATLNARMGLITYFKLSFSFNNLSNNVLSFESDSMPAPPQRFNVLYRKFRPRRFFFILCLCFFSVFAAVFAFVFAGDGVSDVLFLLVFTSKIKSLLVKLLLRNRLRL